MWPLETVDQARSLLADGHSLSQVSTRLGVPRSTVCKWRRGPGPRRLAIQIARSWRPPDGATYCYVLGLYLGDGHLSHMSKNSAVLRIACDAAQPGLIDEAAHALAVTFTDVRVSRYRYRVARRVDLQVCGAVLLSAFPQHGPGKKHQRKIALVPWQRELCAQYPAALIRGLIHSDGCRSINRFKTKLPSGRVAEYEYPRYFFSNLSADIRAIFCEHCELLGIRWTQSNPRNISIAHKKSVAILEQIVGPKS